MTLLVRPAHPARSARRTRRTRRARRGVGLAAVLVATLFATAAPASADGLGTIISNIPDIGRACHPGKRMPHINVAGLPLGPTVYCLVTDH
ncbi:hypothetical protein [Streptomyces sp. XD-27]|uniref:hypothetical protein n=1 Tax=Streptomyces sp. XD-27 TaxID=3062779 RepID=UPI0026F44FCC|nr:hypothetical protein [Streptomyces sp. XD-27]WKX69484.1 hypothetical protein Q3Y56_05765 [Streptomyces sp. XD-27]